MLAYSTLTGTAICPGTFLMFMRSIVNEETPFGETVPSRRRGFLLLVAVFEAHELMCWMDNQNLPFPIKAQPLKMASRRKHMYEDKTSAKVIADTVWDGVRLTTFRVTFPRFILAEVNTHRAFSRNSASSRAIPVRRQIELVEESPFIPQKWPKNQPGMQAKEDLPDDTYARLVWDGARDDAVYHARRLDVAGVHKQIASRLLEPFMWHTAIISSTATGLSNFFLQRDHEDAQPEMQTLARAMRKAMGESEPKEDCYHIPFSEDFSLGAWKALILEHEVIKAISHCARVSYGRELEERAYEKDLELVTRLIRSGHWSPLEHVGVVLMNPPDTLNTLGNFDDPWSQMRHYWGEFLPSLAALV